LESSNHVIETKHAAAVKKLHKMDKDYEELQEKVLQIEESLRETKSNFESMESELDRTKSMLDISKKDNVDLSLKADQDKEFINEIKEALGSQRQENTKLMDIIDRQKFDLDEARSGLQYYVNIVKMFK
jgi:chromosome segregation ATPase